MSLNSTSLPPVTVNAFPPFWYEVALAGISFIPLVIMFWLMFKTDFFSDLMEKLYEGIGKPKYGSEYNCRCSRCAFELRTKKGLKRWRKTHRYRKDELI